jgi:hypothetical protein
VEQQHQAFNKMATMEEVFVVCAEVQSLSIKHWLENGYRK